MVMRAHVQVTDFSLCLHNAEGAEVLSGAPYKGTDPIYEGSTLVTYSPTKGPMS